MTELVSLQGPWFWFIVAGLLLMGELLSPGVFMMWLAGAAALTGFADLAFGLGWTAELIAFAGFSLFTVFASWKHVTSSWSPKSDQPHLNARHGAYVGRIFPLDRAIINGSGKLKIEDVLWDVEGPDLAVGAMVKVTGVDGMRLIAVKAD
jgi:inner membrane protein